MVYTDVLNRGVRWSPQPPRRSAQSRLWRELQDYPDQPVGLIPGGRLWIMREVVINKVVAVQEWHRRFRLRPTASGFIQVGFIMS